MLDLDSDAVNSTDDAEVIGGCCGCCSSCCGCGSCGCGCWRGGILITSLRRRASSWSSSSINASSGATRIPLVPSIFVAPSFFLFFFSSPNEEDSPFFFGLEEPASHETRTAPARNPWTGRPCFVGGCTEKNEVQVGLNCFIYGRGGFGEFVRYHSSKLFLLGLCCFLTWNSELIEWWSSAVVPHYHRSSLLEMCLE